jgi:signal transduction histidine kinase
VRLGSEDYAVTGLSLRLQDQAADPHAPSVLVLRSRTSQLRGLRTINIALLTTAVLAIVLATLLSYAVARSVTRPLGTITATMREVAATGDLTRKIDLPGPDWWQDEDARLVAATFNNLTESVARVQRETAQRDRLLALGRLSTVVAHEVRNPLMIIKGALRSMRPGVPDAEQREAVADIDEQVGRLNRIVHDVLDFARPLQLDFAPADLGRLCNEAAAAVQASEPDGPPIAVRTTPVEIVTDAERLRAALINLLANARQAVATRRRSAEQDGTPLPPAVDDVAITTTVRGSRAQVVITDRGGGIPAEHIAQIFEPYFTTKRSGTGLGLPIARNIIDGLGGTIAIRVGGAGTIVDLDLPIRPPAAARPQSDS